MNIHIQGVQKFAWRIEMCYFTAPIICPDSMDRTKETNKIINQQACRYRVNRGN